MELNKKESNEKYEKPALILEDTDTQADKADPADVVPIISGAAIIGAAIFTKYC